MPKLAKPAKEQLSMWRGTIQRDPTELRILALARNDLQRWLRCEEAELSQAILLLLLPTCVACYFTWSAAPFVATLIATFVVAAMHDKELSWRPSFPMLVGKAVNRPPVTGAPGDHVQLYFPLPAGIGEGEVIEEDLCRGLDTTCGPLGPGAYLTSNPLHAPRLGQGDRWQGLEKVAGRTRVGVALAPTSPFFRRIRSMNEMASHGQQMGAPRIVRLKFDRNRARLTEKGDNKGDANEICFSDPSKLCVMGYLDIEEVPPSSVGLWKLFDMWCGALVVSTQHFRRLVGSALLHEGGLERNAQN